MKFSSGFRDKHEQIVQLFKESFTQSEGSEEGDSIASLVENLFQTTGASDLYVFSAETDTELVGCICFSRLKFEEDSRIAFLLSPVAVHTNKQGQGVGKALLKYGLDELRNKKVDIAITYGDPSYYCQVGFETITEKVVPSPLPLQQPEGWLGMSLTESPLVAIQGKSKCVQAFNDPTLW